MKRMVKLLSRRASGIRCCSLSGWDFLFRTNSEGVCWSRSQNVGIPPPGEGLRLQAGAPFLSPAWGKLGDLSSNPRFWKQEDFLQPFLSDSFHLFGNGTAWLCSLEDRMPRCVCIWSEMAGETESSSPQSNLSHPGLCLSCSERASLGTVASSQCKALGREGRGAELPSLRLCAPRSLKWVSVPAGQPCPVMWWLERALKGAFKSFWQRGKGNFQLSAVYGCSQLLRQRETTPWPCSPRVGCKLVFSKQNILTKAVANAVWIYDDWNGIWGMNKPLWIHTAHICMQEREVWYKWRLGQRQLLGLHLTAPGNLEFVVPTGPGNRRRHVLVFNIQI